MSLESIIGRIIREAEEEATRLRHEAEQRAEKMLASGREEAEKQAAAILQQAEQEGRMEALRLLSQARLEKRLVLLQARRRWVQEVLEKAWEEAGISLKAATRTIVTREGSRVERLDESKIKEDLRLKFENLILEILGI